MIIVRLALSVLQICLGIAILVIMFMRTPALFAWGIAAFLSLVGVTVAAYYGSWIGFAMALLFYAVGILAANYRLWDKLREREENIISLREFRIEYRRKQLEERKGGVSR